MHSTKIFVHKAHPHLAHAARERTLITSFLLGLYDRQHASSFAVEKFKQLRTQSGWPVKARQFDALNCLDVWRVILAEGAYGEQPDDDNDAKLEPFEEEEEDLTAALAAPGYNRRVNNPPTRLPERREAT